VLDLARCGGDRPPVRLGVRLKGLELQIDHIGGSRGLSHDPATQPGAERMLEVALSDQID
jgi:hypothetical protein